MKWIAAMAPLFWATVGFLMVVALAGCAPLQTAETTASLIFPSGLEFSYHSTKDQQGIVVSIEEIDPKTETVIKKWNLVVDKSGTPEAAFKAMAERDKITAETLRALVAKILSAAPPTF